MKILNIFFTLFGVVTVVFFLFQVLPGDPARMMMDQNENEEQLKIINKKYGFDLPVYSQYLFYLNDLSIISKTFKLSQDINTSLTFSFIVSYSINLLLLISSFNSRKVSIFLLYKFVNLNSQYYNR